MRLIDTHCHLFMNPLARDGDSVLARAAEASVHDIVVPAFDLESWDAVCALGRKEGIHPALGLHPQAADRVMIEEKTPNLPAPTAFPNLWEDAKKLEAEKAVESGALLLEEFRDRLATRLQECGAVAIGEIGLDFVGEGPAPLHQRTVLKAQLELAADLGLPVILHCRCGWEWLVASLQPFVGKVRGVIHAYSRNPGLASPFFKCGFFVGLGGSITQPEARPARRSAQLLPLERILLETDAPATGLDGIDPERVEPQHLLDIAQALAEQRGITIEEVAEVTTANAREFFGI